MKSYIAWGGSVWMVTLFLGITLLHINKPQVIFYSKAYPRDVLGKVHIIMERQVGSSVVQPQIRERTGYLPRIPTATTTITRTTVYLYKKNGMYLAIFS